MQAASSIWLYIDCKSLAEAELTMKNDSDIYKWSVALFEFVVVNLEDCYCPIITAIIGEPTAIAAIVDNCSMLAFLQKDCSTSENCMGVKAPFMWSELAVLYSVNPQIGGKPACDSGTNGNVVEEIYPLGVR